MNATENEVIIIIFTPLITSIPGRCGWMPPDYWNRLETLDNECHTCTKNSSVGQLKNRCTGQSRHLKLYLGLVLNYARLWDTSII